MEAEFVACINSGMASNCYAVNIWLKYLNAVERVKSRASASSVRDVPHSYSERYNEA